LDPRVAYFGQYLRPAGYRPWLNLNFAVAWFENEKRFEIEVFHQDS